MTDLLTQTDVFYLGLEFFQTFLLKTSLIVLAAWAITRILHKRSAAVRHATWATAVTCLFVLLPINQLLPSWSTHTVSIDTFDASSTTVSTTEYAYRIPRENAYHADASQTAFSLPTATATENLEKDLAIPVQAPLLGWSMLVYAFTLTWLAGVLVVLVQIGQHIRQTQRLSCSARLISREEAIQRWGCNLGEHLIRRATLVMSNEIEMPMTWGILRPVIALPTEAASWPRERFESVVFHEYAHVVRKDYVTFLMAQLVCAFYWFNPMVYIARRQLILEQERACDDYVLGVGIKPFAYAEHLLQIARDVKARRSSPLGIAMAHPSTLMDRLQSILDRTSKRDRLTRTHGAILVGLMLAITLPLSTLTLWYQEAQTSREADQWILALDDPAPETRQKAAWALGELESPDGVEALVTALDDHDAGVRGMAAWALGEIKDRRAVEPLLAALNDQDEFDKERVITALGELEDHRTIAPMMDLLLQGPRDLQQAAAWALGEIGSPEAVYNLAAAYPESDDRLRLSIVNALGYSTHPVAVGPLNQALSDPSSEVRMAAIQGLKKSHSTEGIVHLMHALENHPDTAIRAASASALAHFGGERVDQALIEALEDPDAEVRAQSAHVLGLRGTVQAIDPLITHMRDPDAAVRSTVVWALDEISLH